MIRSNSLERHVLEAVSVLAEPSTSEVARQVNRNGGNANRTAIRQALRILEDEGAIANVGIGRDAWRIASNGGAGKQ